MRRITFAVASAALAMSAPASAQDKYAMQLLHFNVQYVCGGTIAFLPTKVPELELDGDAIEDRIITESFEPVVDLFEQHPTWGVDLEMQGYMLDVIAARHPALLDKMRAMAKAKQIDIVSFHYSDQLLVGFPQTDWEKSQALTAETFARHDVPLSRTVFCQEGQGAAAMAYHLSKLGYRNMVWPKNLWSYQHGDFNAEPLYRFGDALMVVGGKDVTYAAGTVTIDTSWTFLNDGELLATGDLDPYIVELFHEDPAAVAAYEAKLVALEQQGYRVVTVDQYVDAVKDLVTPASPPTLLDGTWQPESTLGVKRWLGGHGVWQDQERDNHVRTLGAIAHRELVAAETIAKRAPVDARDRLDAAWRLLFLGQVTDASGINPYRGEIEYGIAHLTEAARLAREVIEDAKSTLGLTSALIDPLADTIGEGENDGFVGVPTNAPLTLTIEAGTRAVNQQWELLPDGHTRVVIDFGAGEDTFLSVMFPGEVADELTVGLALDDTRPTVIRRSDFVFELFHFALPTGLIGLSPNRFVVKDMGHVHLAAAIRRDSGDVVFEDETVPAGEPQRWVFHLIDGTAEQAAGLAMSLNVSRRLAR